MGSILWLIYLAEVCNTLTILCISIDIFCFVWVFILGVNVINDYFNNQDTKLFAKKLIKYFAVGWVISTLAVVFLPSKEVLLGAASAQAIEFIKDKDKESPAVEKSLKLLDKQLDSVLDTKEKKE